MITLGGMNVAGQAASAIRAGGFHPDFYIAAASTIPVLFLGFAFQRFWLKQIFSAARVGDPVTRAVTVVITRSAKVVTILLMTSALAGFVAEAFALVVLLNQTSFFGAGIAILISTLYLLLMNIVVMTITWSGTVMGD